jgi:hypothetical protein
MPWGAPAADAHSGAFDARDLGELVDNAKLEFVGKFYNHTLMTPAFTPENKEYGAPNHPCCGGAAHD